MLKEDKGVIVILTIFATIMGGCFLGDFLWLAHKRAIANAEALAEARAEAREITGPCGSQFVATVKNGDVIETYVAGDQVSSSTVHLYPVFRIGTPGDRIKRISLGFPCNIV